MHICQVGSYTFDRPRFGEHTHLVDLLEALRVRGVTVTYVGIDPFDLRACFQRPGQPVERIQVQGADSGSWLDVDLISRISLVNTVVEQASDGLATAVDVVHVHSELAAPAAVALARSARAPLVYTTHVVTQAAADQVIARECLRAYQCYAITTAHTVIAPSTTVSDAIVGQFTPNRLVVIRHPPPRIAPVKTVYAIEDRAVRILFVGRLIPIKGLHLVLPVLGQLSVPVELVIAGDGPLIGPLTDSAREHGVTIRWLGHLPRTDVFAAYRDADLLIFPSLSETFGLVLQEALTAGLPVVTNDIPILRDQVCHEHTGLIVPIDAANGPQLWREAIQRLIDNEALRASLGSAAAASVPVPAWSSYIDLYRAVVG